jgi:hypothetical protein
VVDDTYRIRAFRLSGGQDFQTRKGHGHTASCHSHHIAKGRNRPLAPGRSRLD